MSEDRPADLVGVSHVTLTVRDLAVSVPWYERVLGLTRLDDERRVEGGRVQLLLHAASGLSVGLRQPDEHDGAGFDEMRTGLDHLAFLVEDREVLDRWVARFEELGVEHSPVADSPYGAVLVFRDPDHIQLEMFSSPLQLQMMRPGD